MDADLYLAGWIIAILVLALSWPVAQSLRHDKLRPLAAYLLFTSVFVLVAAAIFLLAVRLGAALLGVEAMEGPAAAFIVLLLSLVPGFAAARWIVRRPQERRMPR